MGMKIYHKKIWLIVLLLVLALISGCGKGEEDSSKSLKVISCLWQEYTIETALESADTIVYGQVTSKSDTKTHEAATLPDGSAYLEYYQSVEIEVLECIKGDSSVTEVEYIEMGGETETEIIEYEGEPELVIGDKVLVFLNENGAPLSPITVVEVDDKGTIEVADEMLPEGVNQLSEIEDYCLLLREMMNE